MKGLGSAVIALIVGVVAIWLLVKLVFFAFKLLGVLIGVALAVGVFFVVRRAIEGPR
jgi:hypothetical protein